MDVLILHRPRAGVVFSALLQHLPSFAARFSRGLSDQRYAIHELHLPRGRALVYRGISGEQFHGSNAS